MSDNDIKKEVDKLAAKYDNIKVHRADYNESSGQLSMEIGLTGGSRVGDFPVGTEVLSESPADIVGSVSDIFPTEYASGGFRRIELDPLTRSDLDLAKTSVLREDPSKLYARSIDYYRTKDVYGSAINTLTNFASKGFENDTENKDVKAFFDNWVVDVGFDDVVEKIFFEKKIITSYYIM
jgi:hypothetical protein